MSNRIFLGPAQTKVDVKERPAAAAILPGSVLVQTAGEFALAGADAGGVLYVAGNDILKDKADAYAAGDLVQGYRPASGEYYLCRLATGETPSEDDALATNATGELVVVDAEENVFGYADGEAENGFVRVYIK